MTKDFCVGHVHKLGTECDGFVSRLTGIRPPTCPHLSPMSPSQGGRTMTLVAVVPVHGDAEVAFLVFRFPDGGAGGNLSTQPSVLFKIFFLMHFQNLINGRSYSGFFGGPGI